MGLTPFSELYPDEFLSRNEENFNLLLEKLALFYKRTRADIGDGQLSRRKIDRRFQYQEELKGVQIDQKGVATEEVASDLNDMMQGCIRHQNPTTAFNLMPAPLFDTVAATTLLSLYNTNTCWDFISGKLCLYEKKILRMLGQLVDWPKADGFVVTGGKQALLYAVKNGMARSSLNEPVEISDQVVICSELAHYSIEHVCHYLGINPENCVRVASLPSGEMDLQAFEKTLAQVILQGKKIAAVIAVGGATINLVPDPVSDVKKSIDRMTEAYQLTYTPFLHVDTVISWAWLAFAKAENDSWKAQVSPRAKEKIEHILSKLSGIEHADSFAADFHKIGFCPYAAGVFIVKEPAALSGMSQDRSLPPEDLRFGEVEIFRQTLENSRPALTIASIWVALRRLGLEGLRQFIAYQLEVSERFKQRIREVYSDHFEVLNEHTNGWEIVIKPHFQSQLSWDQLQSTTEREQMSYSNAAHHFLAAVWYDGLEGAERKIPVIGFVKKYSRRSMFEKSFPAFLIHPCSLHYNEEAIDEMLEGIIQAKIAFESRASQTEETADQYLTQFVPPR